LVKDGSEPIILVDGGDSVIVVRKAWKFDLMKDEGRDGSEKDGSSLFLFRRTTTRRWRIEADQLDSRIQTWALEEARRRLEQEGFYDETK